MINNPRRLKQNGWFISGYESIIESISHKRDNVINNSWVKLNGSYTYYYEDRFKGPEPHKLGLIKFRRK